MNTTTTTTSEEAKKKAAIWLKPDKSFIDLFKEILAFVKIIGMCDYTKYYGYEIRHDYSSVG